MATFQEFHGLSLAANSFIENLFVEQLAADPVPVGAGRVWFNTTDKVFRQSTLDGTGAVVVRTFSTGEELAAAVTALSTAITNEATARANADTNLQNQISALGSAFTYVGTVTGGADAASAFDLATLTQKDAGDYYKVDTSGYFKIGTGTAFYASLNDGLVWNLASGVDIIDNTNSQVLGATNEIAVTGSSDTGFTVAIDSAFKTRVSTLETGLATEITNRTSADTAITNSIGSLSSLTTTDKTTIVAAINEVKTLAGGGVSAFKTQINAARYTTTTTTAATSHTINHALNSSLVDVCVWIDRGDGVWRNDMAAVSIVDANNVKVDLTAARNVRVTVEKMEAFA